ncbi:hAT family C-terminal dimerization region [Phytophthora infestans]|uniref:HAT family C-terminal dimerization region n=1 Tax=Phytophthora infestans TaxID=4787 RepID=A0A8S9TMG6_PHYIN|nr:hAT family C-terminal dimerization region [Phytophthora infestans]
MAFRPEDLTLLASNTRTLVHDAFHKRFFSRYTDRIFFIKCSFVLEMQLFLHLNFKSFDGFLKRVIQLCNADSSGVATAAGDRHFTKIKKTIYDKVRSIMVAVAAPEEVRPSPPVDDQSPAPSTLFSEDLMELFADVIDTDPTEPESTQDLNSTRIDEELERWETAPTSLQINGSRAETKLEFWKRQAETGTYKFLPLVARILFAIPSSSAQIERDFGTAGQLVTPQRGSIAPHNVDMSASLNCNRQFVDVTQCPKIHVRDIDKFIPSNVKVGMEEDDAEGCELLSGYFSSDSEEDIEDTET